MTIEIIKGSENPVTDFFSSPSNTPVTDEMKCLSLIEVMELPRERRTIALRVLQAIKERDEARQQLRIAVGLLSTHPQFANKHPEDVLAFVKEGAK
jgi:hypothetical protein